MLSNQVERVKEHLKNSPDWMNQITNGDLAYFHGKYPELFQEEREVIDRDLKMRKVTVVRKEFFGKLPVYELLRKHGKVRKCEWAENEIKIQKTKKEQKQNGA